MQLKFDSSLDYQQDAIKAVVDVFEGQSASQSNFEIVNTANQGTIISEYGIGNQITLDDEAIKANVDKIQTTNKIATADKLFGGRNFTIEMETGTGKTYIYLRSIFELSKSYGFKKFIVVVPSVAIREGVLKSIAIMRTHFNEMYSNTPFSYFVYDSKKLNNIRQFADDNQIQIMIINIQAFQKDIPDEDKDTITMTDNELKKLNVIHRENDKTSGYKPIEFIQATNPLVIIDEPQSVDNTPKAKKAIKSLNPIATFRYSATHKDHYNLLYKLDPIRAYDLRLVKRIEVASILADDSFNNAYIKLLKTDNKNGIKAQIEIDKQQASDHKKIKLWVKLNDNLDIPPKN